MKPIHKISAFLFLLLSITSYSQDFGNYSSAVWINRKGTSAESTFYNLSFKSPNGYLTANAHAINYDLSKSYDGRSFGTHNTKSKNLLLQGAEVKTFKKVAGNNCSSRLDYVIYKTGARPEGPTFTEAPIEFFNECNLGTSQFPDVPGHGACNTSGYQKWQSLTIGGNPFTDVDLTDRNEGNYSLELFVRTRGSNSGGTCDSDQFDNNGGANYKSTFTICPTYTSGEGNNPTTCGGNGTIVLNVVGIDDGTYSDRFFYDVASVFSNVVVSGGVATITVPAGTYTNVRYNNPDFSGCSDIGRDDFTLMDPITPIIVLRGVSAPTTCSGDNGSIQLNGLLNTTTYTVDYLKDGLAVSASISTNGSGVLTITGLTTGTYTNIRVTSSLSCQSNTLAGPITLIDPITPRILLSSNSSPTTCSGSNGTIQLSGLLNNTTYTVNYLKGGVAVSASIATNGTGVLTINGLTAGTYTNISVTSSASCQSNTLAGPVTLTDPTTPAIVLGGSSNPTTCSGSNGTIQLSDLLNTTTYTVDYLKDGIAVSASIATNGTGVLTITGLTAGTYTNISVTSSASCQSNTLAGPITLTDPVNDCNLSTTDLYEFKNVIISPNPASDNVTVKISIEVIGSQFKLFDLTGRQLLSKSLQSETNIVNVSALSKGTYIYNIEQNGKITFSKKLVIE